MLVLKSRSLLTALSGLIVFALSPYANASPTTLANDTYSGAAAQLAVQGGFVKGEGFSSVFVPATYPFTVQKVLVLIAPGPGAGPSTDEYQMRVSVDEPGVKEPGIVLYDEKVEIESSDKAISELDISALKIAIPQGKHVRVTFIQYHDGPPSIVRDEGPRKAKRNLIYGNVGLGATWYWLDDLDGLGMVIPGNWIIRVVGDAPGAPPLNDAGAVADSAPTGQDAGVIVQKDAKTADSAGGTGGESQPCYPNDTCNAGLTCLSKVCVKVPSADAGTTVPAKDGGCSLSSNERSAGSLLLRFVLGLPLVFVGLWRRRRR
jgi:hypothetical protein